MDKSIIQKLNITHDQHYVQQRYLHNWDKDNQLFYIDKKYNKLINKGTKSVCFEYDFYKLNKLSLEEKKIFNILYSKLPRQLLDKVNELINLLDFEIDIEADDYKIKMEVEKIYKENRSTFENLVFALTGENLLCDIEKGLSEEIWKKLYNADENIVNNEQDRVNLYAYIIGQAWRVPPKKIEVQNILNKMSSTCNIDVSVDRMFPYFVYNQSMIESAFMASLNKHKLVYLIIPDNLDIEFITSDNPVINLCKDFDENGKLKTYEFFWPINPKLALIITEDNEKTSSQLRIDEIEKFNSMIFENTFRYVIAHNKDFLLGYMK